MHSSHETGHDHTHGPECGHQTEQHGDHIHYMHDGHRHRQHEDHWDECALEERVEPMVGADQVDIGRRPDVPEELRTSTGT